MNMHNTSDENFEKDVLKNKKPVLVDFWAEWCGPCQQLKVTLGHIAKEYKDKIEIFKINVDENPEIPTKYGIRSLPTMMIFKNGEKKSTKIGALPQNKLEEWIDEEI